jgi:hypothetical protein
VTSDERNKLCDAGDVSTRDLVLWCLEALGWATARDDAGVYRIVIPPETAVPNAGVARPDAEWDGHRFTLDPAPDAPGGESQAIERVTFDSPLMCLLRQRLAPDLTQLHAVAVRQPLTVHELTGPLFAPYDVEEGHTRLAGCTLEDRPFLRLSYLRAPSSDAAPQVVHCFGTSDGALLTPDMIDGLELQQLALPSWRVPSLDRNVVQQWIAVTSRLFAERGGEDADRLLVATVVWCRYAEGKLTFTIGSKSVEVAFAGWARLLADRRVLPPPYACPLSGLSSYHLAATDDGRITVAEAIATCAESTRRVLLQDLECCAASGRRVLPSYLETCPVTGQRVLGTRFQTCGMCRQRVSPQALQGDRCLACESLSTASAADPRLARVLGAFPKLDRWRRWKIAETRTVQILVGTSMFRRLLVVLDRQSLDVLHVASGARCSSRWTATTEVQRGEWVG